MIICPQMEAQVHGAYAIAAGLLLVPGAAEAAPFSFFCAAPLAHRSQMMQVQPGPTYRVRGRVGPVQLEDIPDPSLPLRMEGHDIPSNTRSADVMFMNFETGNMVLLTVTPRYPGNESEAVADVQVQTGVDGVDSIRQLTTLGSRGFMWDDLTFDIEVREDRVIVEAGGRREEFAVTIGRGAMVVFSCIGGSFDFEALDWDG